MEYYSQFRNVVDVRPLAQTIRQEVRDYASKNPMKLVGILSSPKEFRHDAELYGQHIARTCEEDSIDFEVWRCKPESPEDVLEMIQRANCDDDIDGTLVFYPIYPGRTKSRRKPLRSIYYNGYDDLFRSQVSPLKDVEGLSKRKWYSAGTSLDNMSRYDISPSVQPCTSKAVQAILEVHHFQRSVCELCVDNPEDSPWHGRTISIFNRSEVFGRPLATTLAAAGATVFSIDANGMLRFSPFSCRVKRCEESALDCLSQSEVIVTGIPSENFCVPSGAIMPGTTVVNVSEFSYANEDNFLERDDIRYVPKVGSVTVSMLLANLAHLHRERHGTSDCTSQYST